MSIYLASQLYNPNFAQTSGAVNTPTGPAGGSLTGTYPTPTLNPTGVTASTYGDGTHVPQVTVAADGRVTTVTNVSISPTGGPPTGSAGGDLTGSYPNPTVNTVQGYNVIGGTDQAGATYLALGRRGTRYYSGVTNTTNDGTGFVDAMILATAATLPVSNAGSCTTVWIHASPQLTSTEGSYSGMWCVNTYQEGGVWTQNALGVYENKTGAFAVGGPSGASAVSFPNPSTFGRIQMQVKNGQGNNGATCVWSWHALVVDAQ